MVVVRAQLGQRPHHGVPVCGRGRRLRRPLISLLHRMASRPNAQAVLQAQWHLGSDTTCSMLPHQVGHHVILFVRMYCHPQ